MKFQEHDYRILLANDASTDKSGLEIQDYINERGFNLLIHLLENKENIGTAPTMRKLFRLALDLKSEIVIKLDMDRDFSQGEVLEKFLSTIADQKRFNHNTVLAGIRTLPNGKVMTFYERVHRRIMNDFLEKTLAVHDYDPVSAGTQLYPVHILKELMKEKVVQDFNLRWGMDVLLSMLAKRKGYDLITIPIIRSKYDTDRRQDKKVKSQYEAFYKVFEGVYDRA